MRFSDKAKRIIKKGFVGIEYCVIGAIIILGCLTMYRISTSNTRNHMEHGALEMGDDPGVIFTESTGKGYLITSLDVIPGDISLKLGETKKVTTIIAPSNVWNYQLKWDISDYDSTIVNVTPTNGTTEANLTGLTEGKALIQVKTMDGSELSKDVIVRVGYPITEFSVVGERVFNASQIGVLDIVFDDEDVTFDNKSIDLTLVTESEFGGEGVATSGTPKLQTKVADFVLTETGRIIIYPNQGGTVRFDVTITDHVFETSYTETVDISIQSYYYRYRDLKDWSEWSTTKVEGAYNEEKTQYGYQTVKTWNNVWLTSKPTDGYYNSRTQYGYQTVATWKDEWLTTQPTDGYYAKRTQYGYKDVASWSTTPLKSKPVDGYYKTGTAGGETGSYSNGNFVGPSSGSRSQTFDLGAAYIPTQIRMSTYCHTHVAKYTWYGSNDGSSWTTLGTGNTSKGSVAMNDAIITPSTSIAYRYYSYIYSASSAGYKGWDSSVEKCTGTASGYNNGGYDQFADITFSYKTPTYTAYYAVASWGAETWSTTATAAFEQTTSRMPLSRTTYRSPSTWNSAVWSTSATSAYAKTTSQKPLSRTTYQTPATWNDATGWRDSTPYTQTYTTKPLTRTMYRYKEYGAWSDWFMCDISGCPESTTTREVEVRNGVS